MTPGDDFLFDANASGNPHQTNEQIRQELEQIVNPIWTNRHGETYTVTKLDILSSRVRATIRRAVEVLDPEAYQEYLKIRNRGLKAGERPGLAQSREAYRFLAQRFIDLTYNIAGS
jgi:hypothetical protein